MGTTYKLKTPEHVSEHSLFITINDIILNEARCTRPGARSRSSSTQEPGALSVDSGADPHHLGGVSQGGTSPFWWRSCARCSIPRGLLEQGQVRASLIAEIGNVIETHLYRDRHAQVPGLDEHQQAFPGREAGAIAGTATGRRAAGGQRFPTQCRALLQVPPRRWCKRMAA